MSLFLKNKSFVKKAALFLVCQFAFSNAYAGGLLVTPSRVELDSKNKSQEIRLVNNGKETTTYRISFQNLRMNEDGSYAEITDKEGAKENFAEEYVRFSPKRVTLKPGESQAVRVKASIPEKAGEYRSHMLFKEELPADFGNNVEESGKDKKSISLVLRPVFAISIPVIISSGEVSATVELENPKIVADKDGKTKLIELFIKRTGNGSTNGKIIANLVDKASKSETEILSVSNISVFFPYEGRAIKFPIKLPKDTKLSGKRIEVKYIARKSEEQQNEKDKVLAETSFASGS